MNKFQEKEFIDINDLILKHVKKSPVLSTLKKKIDLDCLSCLDIQDNLTITQTRLTYSQKNLQASPSSIKSEVVFSSTFVNNSDRDQTNHLRTERSTKSVCQVRITKGIKKEGSFSIQLTPPSIGAQFNAGFKKEYSIENAEDYSTEETLTWSLDSEIIVPARTQTNAKLVIIEEEYNGDFEVEVLIEGNMKFNIVDKKNRHLLGELTIHDLQKVFPPEKGFIPVDKNSVKFISYGSCFCRYGVAQRVDLDQITL